MTANPKLYERVKLFKDTVQTKNENRVVNFGNMWTWVIADNGDSLNENARNYNMRLNSMDKFQQRYQFDFYTDFNSCNPAPITDALGGGACKLIDDPFDIVIEDHNYMVTPEDYDLCMKDYKQFQWTKLMPKKFPKLLEGNAVEMINKSTLALDEYFKYCYDVEDMMVEKHGTLAFFSGRSEFLTFFLQNLFLDFCGMKQMSVDMRRYPDKIKEACDFFGLMGNKSTEKGSYADRAHDYTFRGLAQSFLSPKQFEKFIYPSLKQLYNYAEEYDKIIFCFWQSENSRFYDFLKEAPKGHFMYYFEKDDLFNTKKIFENHVAIGGGMPSHMLYYSSPKECVDYAKKLIDSLGYDGKYMFGADIMVSYPRDCKRENLLAVNEFVNNYK